MRFFGQCQLAFLFLLFSFLTREITQRVSITFFNSVSYYFFLFLETAVYLIVSIGPFRAVCCCCCCCKNVCIVYEYCLLRIKLRHWPYITNPTKMKVGSLNVTNM